jgi:hypothetical protein
MQTQSLTLWRINIKTGAEAGVDPRKFCLDQQCLGVGWPVSDAEALDWDSYYTLAATEYKGDKGWWPAINALRNRMAESDLCWTRDTAGIYYLGRIIGPWQYIGSLHHRRADVVNTRACEWLQVGPVDAVPGKIVNSFGPSRTVQAVDDDTAKLFSAYYYNKHTTSGFRYQLSLVAPDIFSLLSSEDCEDLVALYMQMEGYLLLPSTCKPSTSAYEWVMTHKDSGGRACAQVKNGYDDLDVQEYSTFPGKVYLFTSKGHYLGADAHNVECLSTNQLREFIQNHEAILPERIKVWIAIAKELSSATEA